MRSLLFVPGDNERKLEKAASCGADALILDLEDSVAPNRKLEARAMTLDYLKSAASQSPSLCVRINSLDTPIWRTDLDTIAAHPPALIMLPKARGGKDIQTLSEALAEHDMSDTRIIALVTETPVSILRMETYLDHAKTVEALTWGAEDLSVELGARTNRTEQGRFTSPYEMVRNLTLITAAAIGTTAIDTVFTNFRDTVGLEREAADAARDGFTGKMAIHPAQVAPINAAFTPTSAQCARAHAIIEGFKAAGDGVGVINLDGEMIDEPHRKQAERLLKRAEHYEKASP